MKNNTIIKASKIFIFVLGLLLVNLETISSSFADDIPLKQEITTNHVVTLSTSDTPAKYKVGDTVKISSNAAVETNGYDLSNHRNWSGTIMSVSPKAYSHSAWEYYIKYPDGEHNDFVAEQDVTNITPAKYRVGDTVKISSNAAVETNGYDLSNHRNWSGTIMSVSPKAYSHSAWEYYIKYPDGEHNDFVAEQDLIMPTSYPHPEDGTSNTYYWGYCTYGAKQLAPWIGNGWGNANQWSSSARSAGYVVDRNPVYGSIVVFQSGQGGASSYGHVAFVESINGNTIQIKEMNGTGGFGQYSVRSVDNASSYEYIH